MLFCCVWFLQTLSPGPCLLVYSMIIFNSWILELSSKPASKVLCSWEDQHLLLPIAWGRYWAGLNMTSSQPGVSQTTCICEPDLSPMGRVVTNSQRTLTSTSLPRTKADIGYIPWPLACVRESILVQSVSSEHGPSETLVLCGSPTPWVHS